MSDRNPWGEYEDPAEDLVGTARLIRTDDTLQARSDRAAGDVWLPVVYVTTAEPQGIWAWGGGTVIGLGSAASGLLHG